ncbi:MAG: hypothetical protein HIU83_16900 [Proteobacteria bacterium]|nr:hypothetical protein [Pseudomonadota bacterium]
MNIKIISTSLLVITVVMFLVILAFHTKFGATDDTANDLRTTGNTCGICSYMASKPLEATNQ